jgi:hypothetical protein
MDVTTRQPDPLGSTGNLPTFTAIRSSARLG